VQLSTGSNETINHTEGGSFMDWQLIFEQSPVNGGVYTGDQLVQRVFNPAKNTWFQKRLDHVRAELKKEILDHGSGSIKDH
jgi:hypothetical protein